VKIAHVIDHFQPWMGYQETYLAREQQKLGHDILVITSCSYARPARSIAGDRPAKPGIADEGGVRVCRLPVRFEAGTRAAHVWLKGLPQILSRFVPDVIHCHGVLSFTCFQAAVLKHRFGYRLVLDTHMADFNVYQPGEHWSRRAIKRFGYKAFAQTFGRTIARAADSLVAIGEPERDFISPLFGWRFAEIPIIRLGADNQLFRFAPAARTRVRADLGWSDEEVVLGHAGTLRASKEIETLLEACAILKQAGAPVRVLLIGSIGDAYLQRLRALSAEHNLEGRVVFQGFTPPERLPDYFSAMDLAVWPGDISNTAIEAMSVGLPVVACRTSYTESIIERHGSGVLFDRSNRADLARVLTPLVRDQAVRAAYAARARAAVERELNWRSIAEQFIHLYSRVLEDRYAYGKA